MFKPSKNSKTNFETNNEIIVKMKQLLILTVFTVNSFLVFGQPDETIKEFSFQTGSMIGKKTIIIHEDSVFFETIRRTTPMDTTRIRKELPKSDWINLLNSIADQKFIDLIDLPSPTNLRAVDAASSSTLSITTDKARYDCGFFDNYQSHKKLAALMVLIQEIEKKN